MTFLSRHINSAADAGSGIGRSAVTLYLGFAVPWVLFGAILHALLPFDGDQSIFALAGETIASGGQPYVDYWDVKQPGIFFFYAAGGSIFGFTSLGIHTFELVWWTVVLSLVTVLVRPLLDHVWLASAVPLVFLATYFGHGGWWYATQVEILVSGLLALALILVCRALEGSLPAWVAYFWAGICAGLTILFKVPLALCFIVLFGAIWYHLAFEKKERNPLPYAVSFLAVVCGVAAVVAPVLGWFFANDLLDELFYVTIEYPQEVINEGVPQQLGYLRALSGVAFSLFALAALLPAVVAHFAFDHARKPLLYRLSLVVIGGILVAILIQIYSLWEYHFQLLFLPAALLFVLALDRFLTLRSEKGRSSAETATVAVAVLLAAVIAGQVSAQNWRPAYLYVKHVVMRGESFSEFEVAAYTNMREMRLIADAAPDIVPGEAIYVFGDPTLHHLTNTHQAARVPGWYWELAPRRLFDWTAADLSKTLPRRIFMAAAYRDLVLERSPAIRALLEQRYRITAEIPQGQWYAVR